ncbi:thiamine pyrophosphate-binding protein [Myceligenerans pegani]|uniref:Thiamine pyrophosphate-binding protein n=1 Tax=Myceligenerans pegani TaxID=2776917 RepID=A0ABR9MZX2_9MICO|nr:thiamine pyrophosphate-binding protein [Myceligenerans sp. TRM 65318]MBE1876934.1 thiamine pyrophosphate-binding protein [Myceligenerans sp. TRM 65318]MBE3019205.1 thiamine pyrophosphate-binding protein [Myceligenerans sp. TRM 65318]
MTTVSEAVAHAVAACADDVFALMGNGNAHLLDALSRTDARVTAVRHEAATVASADAYHRITGRLAVATTTYGPGFTNAVTPLAEASLARTPMLLVTGDAPAAGQRDIDVDQAAIARATGALVRHVNPAAPGRQTVAAVQEALVRRRPVVLGIPYDQATAEARDDTVPVLESRPELPEPREEQIEAVAALVADAKRPLLLAGRGAVAAAAEVRLLADRIGALTTTSAPARGMFAGRRYDVGVCGGFASPSASELIRQADVVLVLGAGLNDFQTAFGTAFAPGAKLVQVDVAARPTHASVALHLRADVGRAVVALLGVLEAGETPTEPWCGVAHEAGERDLHHLRDTGEGVARDGRMDPRSLFTYLDRMLPKNRQVVSDGGHFIGWAPSYLSVPRADATVLVGTAYQSIGLGFPSAPGALVARPDVLTVVVTGDGGGVMGIADLETVVRLRRSTLVVVVNDAVYGAEVHQYGSQGLDQDVMRVSEMDFAAIARGFGAQAVTLTRPSDLDWVVQWVRHGARGTLVVDAKVSPEVVAPYMQEMVAQARR